MSKFRPHSCMACFLKCDMEKCDGNHKCMNCGGDYLIFTDKKAIRDTIEFLNKRKKVC